MQCFFAMSFINVQIKLLNQQINVPWLCLHPINRSNLRAPEQNRRTYKYFRLNIERRVSDIYYLFVFHNKAREGLMNCSIRTSFLLFVSFVVNNPYALLHSTQQLFTYKLHIITDTIRHFYINDWNTRLGY